MRSNRFNNILVAMFFIHRHVQAVGELPTSHDIAGYMSMSPQGVRKMLDAGVQCGLIRFMRGRKLNNGKHVKRYANGFRFETLYNVTVERTRTWMLKNPHNFSGFMLAIWVSAFHTEIEAYEKNTWEYSHDVKNIIEKVGI